VTGSKTAEREQHDREGRHLRRERHREALDDEPGQARKPRPQAGRDGRAPGEQAAVAAAESWNPASVTVGGLARTRMTTAHASARAAVPGRPVSRASRATAAMTAARRTDADAPARTV